jgi:hypothetical protein
VDFEDLEGAAAFVETFGGAVLGVTGDAQAAD